MKIEKMMTASGSHYMLLDRIKGYSIRDHGKNLVKIIICIFQLSGNPDFHRSLNGRRH